MPRSGGWPAQLLLSARIGSSPERGQHWATRLLRVLERVRVSLRCARTADTPRQTSWPRRRRLCPLVEWLVLIGESGRGCILYCKKRDRRGEAMRFSIGLCRVKVVECLGREGFSSSGVYLYHIACLTEQYTKANTHLLKVCTRAAECHCWLRSGRWRC